jgi:hypothetical protein
VRQLQELQKEEKQERLVRQLQKKEEQEVLQDRLEEKETSRLARQLKELQEHEYQDDQKRLVRQLQELEEQEEQDRLLDDANILAVLSELISDELEEEDRAREKGEKDESDIKKRKRGRKEGRKGKAQKEDRPKRPSVGKDDEGKEFEDEEVELVARRPAALGPLRGGPRASRQSARQVQQSEQRCENTGFEVQTRDECRTEYQTECNTVQVSSSVGGCRCSGG